LDGLFHQLFQQRITLRFLENELDHIHMFILNARTLIIVFRCGPINAQLLRSRGGANSIHPSAFILHPLASNDLSCPFSELWHVIFAPE
jgi:hypothetical protein